jgi:hypothetical protein
MLLPAGLCRRENKPATCVGQRKPIILELWWLSPGSISVQYWFGNNESFRHFVGLIGRCQTHLKVSVYTERYVHALSYEVLTWLQSLVGPRNRSPQTRRVLLNLRYRGCGVTETRKRRDQQSTKLLIHTHSRNNSTVQFIQCRQISFFSLLHFQGQWRCFFLSVTDSRNLLQLLNDFRL